MGAASRRTESAMRKMTAEERQLQGLSDERVKATLGEFPKPHGVYAVDGCPRCGGAADKLTMRWCQGNFPLEGLDNPVNGCPLGGEHLHGACQCGFFWFEQVKDYQDNPRATEAQ